MLNRKSLILALAFAALSSFVFAQSIEEKAADTSNAMDASDFTGSVQVALSNSDYMVTAGDVYSLTYAANGTPVSFTIAVDPTYRIRVSNLAVLDASGRSYINLKKQVEEIVQKNYPMSGVQFVLLNPGSFKVTVKGEVLSTVERNAWALTRLSSVIGGTLTSYSSTRNIQVTSSNGTTKTYDLYKATRMGDLTQNPYVRPGDVVTINRLDRKVTLSGSVERPGTYELLEGENLQELIYGYGNGLTVQADLSRVELTRIVDTANVTGEKIYLSKEDSDSNYELKNYDRIYIGSYSSLKPVMFIEGAISSTENASLETSSRLSIQFEPGTNYGNFIRSHSGWFTATSDIGNAYILRGDQKIPFDLRPVLYDVNYYCPITMQENDTLMVPYKQYFVTVAGSVVTPGRYPYIPDRTYEYYVALAGGFIRTQNVGGAVKIKDINGNTVDDREFITPECKITAQTNSFTYYFTQYAPIVTTVLDLIVTSITVFNYLQK